MILAHPLFVPYFVGMKIILKSWTGTGWRSVHAFVRKLTLGMFREKLPARHRRQPYITKQGRVVSLHLPWASGEELNQTAVIELAESEIFLLANLARRNRTDTELLQAIAKSKPAAAES